MVKNPPANVGDTGDAGLIPGLGRSPGEGNGNSLQYCLENPMDRGAWWAIVHGVIEESDTSEQLSRHIQTSYPAPASPFHPQVLVSYAGSKPLMTSRYHLLWCVCVFFLVSGFWGVPLFSCKFFKDVLLSVCMHAC